MSDTSGTIEELPELSTDGAKALLEEFRRMLGMYGEDPAYADAADYVEPPAYGDTISAQDLKEVMDYLDLPEETQNEIYEQWEANGEYTTGSVINIVVNNETIVNEVDQSQNIYGEVHGGVHQANESQIINADDGAVVAGGDQHGVQALTGDDSLQIGGDNDGPVTQGDGNVSLDGAHINDSAIAFGEGDAANQADDTEIRDSYNDESVDTDIEVTVSDSLNEDHTATATHEVDVDAHLTDSANYDSDTIYDNDEHDIDESYNHTHEDAGYGGES